MHSILLDVEVITLGQEGSRELAHRPISGNEAFPFLAFEAEVAARASDARLRNCWLELTELPCDGTVLVGKAAIDEYLAIPERCAIEQQNFEYRDGNILRIETGSAAQDGYLLRVY